MCSLINFQITIIITGFQKRGLKICQEISPYAISTSTLSTRTIWAYCNINPSQFQPAYNFNPLQFLLFVI